MMTSAWGDGLAEWWRQEVHDDPAYREVVTPLLLSLVGSRTGGIVLDLGCGEGRVVRALERAGWSAAGLDQDLDLLRVAHVPSVRGRIPDLGMVRDASLGGVVMSLVLEHLPAHRPVFVECARIVRPGGFLVLVVNHPIFTAPGAGPVVDVDGETLWRPGEYFSEGHTEEPAGEGRIRFHHRPLGELLTAAAESGWALGRLLEEGPSGGQISQYPALADQRHIPRLLGVRWTRSAGTAT